MKFKIAFFLLSLIFISCNNSGVLNHNRQASTDSTKFYSTRSFFQNQLAVIPTMKKKIMIFNTVGEQKDSAVLSLENFLQLGNEFLLKDISDPAIKSHYRETVFQDAATGSYTLSYSAVDTTVLIKGMDILLHEQTNQVQRIFIRTAYRKQDSTVMEQHNWNTAKGFQIIRSTTNAQGYAVTKLTEVKWEEWNKE